MKKLTIIFFIFFTTFTLLNTAFAEDKGYYYTIRDQQIDSLLEVYKYLDLYQSNQITKERAIEGISLSRNYVAIPGSAFTVRNYLDNSYSQSKASLAEVILSYNDSILMISHIDYLIDQVNTGNSIPVDIVVGDYKSYQAYNVSPLEIIQTIPIDRTSLYTTLEKNLQVTRAGLRPNQSYDIVNNKFYCDEGYEFSSALQQCEELIITSSGEQTTAFSDTDNSQYKLAISTLKGNGVIGGYPDGTFRPQGLINRAEFLKIVIEAKGITPKGNSCFPDVKTEWYASYVCTAKDLQIIKGYPDGTFKASNNIALSEALKIVLSTFTPQANFSSSIGEWYEPYVDYSTSNNLWLPSFDDVSKTLTREEMAELVYRLVDLN